MQMFDRKSQKLAKREIFTNPLTGEKIKVSNGALDKWNPLTKTGLQNELKDDEAWHIRQAMFADPKLRFKQHFAVTAKVDPQSIH